MMLNLLIGILLNVNGMTLTCGPTDTYDYIHVRANDTVVQGCKVVGNGVGQNAIQVDGDRNVIRNVLVTNAGGTGVYFMSGTDNVLEHSTIKDPVRRPGIDSWGIYGGPNIGKLTIRKNLVWGSGFTNWSPYGTTLIEDNVFTIPPNYRTDCKGNKQLNGPCQCGEFGVALKSGNVTIRGNTMSGYRQADEVCGGTGTPGIAIALPGCGISCPMDNVVVESNKLSDSTYGIYIAPVATRVRIEGNKLCRNDYGISDGFSDGLSSIINNEFFRNGIDLHFYGSARATVGGSRKVAEDCK